MSNPIFLQVQMLLAALSALLPLTPEGARAKLAGVLDLAAQALRIGQASTRELDDLAVKLLLVRNDIEAMAAEGRLVSPARLDEAFDRVSAASSAFRAALTQAGA
jgi:hypothetical protein